MFPRIGRTPAHLDMTVNFVLMNPVVQRTNAHTKIVSRLGNRIARPDKGDSSESELRGKRSWHIGQPFS